jgi:hypothetical protein
MKSSEQVLVSSKQWRIIAQMSEPITVKQKSLIVNDIALLPPVDVQLGNIRAAVVAGGVES